MNDAGAMRTVERVGDLNADTERFVQFQRSLLQPPFERFTLEVLQDQERGALVLADVVQRADVWVIELRNRPGFAIEALAEPGIGRHRGRQHLYCDDAIEPGVAGFVDLAHAA
jgi:hypothetical protein